jgi:hypothetical protein
MAARCGGYAVRPMVWPMLLHWDGCGWNRGNGMPLVKCIRIAVTYAMMGFCPMNTVLEGDSTLPGRRGWLNFLLFRDVLFTSSQCDFAALIGSR